MCGEKLPVSSRGGQSMGSPPRMRRKDPELKTGNYTVGITPACAGKSSAPPRCIRRSRDHPRVCGEKQKLIFEITMESRITPAYAGKRDRPRSGPGTTRDHPRVCGEKCLDGIAHGMIAGSPPRVRGKVKIIWFFNGFRGITPAYAGKRRRMPRPPRKA